RRPCPQGDSQADLSRPSNHGIRDQSIDADACEQQRGRRKETGKLSQKPLLRDAAADPVGERCYSLHRKARGYFRDRLPKLRGEGARVASRSNFEVARIFQFLAKRMIGQRPNALAEVVESGIPDHAGNFKPSMSRAIIEAPADGAS